MLQDSNPKALRRSIDEKTFFVADTATAGHRVALGQGPMPWPKA